MKLYQKKIIIIFYKAKKHMGGKVSNTLRKQKSTFMSASETKYTEQVEHIYNTGGFGNTPQDRYDAMDDAITNDDALVGVLK